jgi:hypothetical protein
MQPSKEDLGPWDRRLLARLHTLTAAQQDAIMQTIDLLVAQKPAAPSLKRQATIIPIRRK